MIHDNSPLIGSEMSKDFFLPAEIKGASKANMQKLFPVFDVPLGLSLTMLELVL